MRGDARLVRGVQHPLGAAHVGVEHALAVLLGDADLVDRADVEDRVGAVDAALDRVHVGEVALDQLGALLAQRVGLVGRAHERHHLVAAL